MLHQSVKERGMRKGLELGRAPRFVQVKECERWKTCSWLGRKRKELEKNKMRELKLVHSPRPGKKN